MVDSMWCNTQVTYSASPNNARSESELEFNPLNPSNVVGASKRFNNPATYDFTLAAYFSFDGGQGWAEAPPLALLSDPDPNKVWSGVSDPTIAWDASGNCYLAALPFPAPPSPFETLGIAIYRSTDGGQHWSAPNFIHASTGDDKQWIESDQNLASPHFGHVYCAWDNGSQLAFARTVDAGVTWIGPGAQPVGTPLAFDSFGPSITVAKDGGVHIFWISGTTVKCVSSTDGGATFSAPQVVASGVITLSMGLPAPGGFPEFPGGKFRVLTLVSAASAGATHTLVVAWADFREGVSRVYYRRSIDGGVNWLGSASGDPLLPWYVASGADQQDFHPQMDSSPDGRLACAFYEFGPKWSGGPPWIDTVIAISNDGGATFSDRQTVSTVPWDPAVDAPLSHGDPKTTFIGDYFGLAADANGFMPFWTDTRTGIQEIFCGRKLNIGPWTGVQFQGTVSASSTHRWFTWGWPACWHVAWTVVPTTPRPGSPQIRWRVDVERASPGNVTYWIVIDNLTDQDVDVEARFAVFAAD
jgi:hypothetical protein